VTFIAEAQIEARVAELWRQHSLAVGFDVERLLDDLKLDLCWELLDDTDGRGAILGQLIPAKRLVVLNERHKERLEKDGGRQLRFTIGHEVGHWILHSEGLGEGSSPTSGRCVGMARGSRSRSKPRCSQPPFWSNATPYGQRCQRGSGEVGAPVYALAESSSLPPLR